MAGRGMFSKLGLTMPAGSRKASNSLLHHAAQSYNRVMRDDGTEDGAKLAARSVARSMGVDPETGGKAYQRETLRMLRAKAHNRHEIAQAENAPPKHREMTAGAHHDGVEGRGGITPQQVERAMYSMRNNPKILAALESSPVGRIALLAGKHQDDEGNGLGWYYGIGRNVSVNATAADGLRTALPASTERHKLLGTMGKPWSISAISAHDDHHERIITHEVGHHLHGMANKGADAHHGKVDAVVQDGFKRGRPLTKNAEMNPDEYFAESFAAYVHHPTILSARDPVGYKMVERVLELRAGQRALKSTDDLYNEKRRRRVGAST